jgi:predicted glycoside hydrolase/deacetylase ChbG (UPF0249 family)
MKKLLLTTDDFGMCHAINEGIVQAMTRGLATSTNFLAPAPWFHEAVDLAREQRLAVGVHLCLGSDWDRLGWGPLTGNGRLMGPDGRFPQRPESLEEAGASDADVYEELAAQVRLVQRCYGQPTHVETHMLGGRWRGGFVDRLQGVVVALARDFKLAYTYERERSTGELKHFLQEDCHSGWSRSQLLQTLASWTEPGCYHLFGHAAVASPELEAMCSPQHPARKWAAELRLMDQALYLDESLRKDIEALGFDLVGVEEALRP